MIPFINTLLNISALCFEDQVRWYRRISNLIINVKCHLQLHNSTINDTLGKQVEMRKWTENAGIWLAGISMLKLTQQGGILTGNLSTRLPQNVSPQAKCLADLVFIMIYVICVHPSWIPKSIMSAKSHLQSHNITQVYSTDYTKGGLDRGQCKAEIHDIQAVTD